MSRPARARPEPIAVTVLTGFLGAGKTTLLNRLLRDPDLADTAVIINEFGEIGIDHLLVENAADGVIELAAGCLCCTVRGDLIATLEDLLRKRDNKRVAPFRRAVIETTGLADPAPVLQTLMLHPYIMLRYRLAGVVTLVDAVNGLSTLDRHPESVRQVAMADRLLVSKAELASPETLAALRDRLARLAPGRPVLDAGEVTAPGALLAAPGWTPDERLRDIARWLAAAPPEAHAHGPGAVFDVNRHSDRIRAFTLATGRPIPAMAFETFLEMLRGFHGDRLLRLKGLVKLAEAPDRPVVVHGVQHVFHPPEQLAAWPDDDHRTRLVFIVDGIPPEAVERLFGAFAGAVAVDTPDAAALAENPLALR